MLEVSLAQTHHNRLVLESGRLLFEKVLQRHFNLCDHFNVLLQLGENFAGTALQLNSKLLA